MDAIAQKRIEQLLKENKRLKEKEGFPCTINLNGISTKIHSPDDFQRVLDDEHKYYERLKSETIKIPICITNPLTNNEIEFLNQEGIQNFVLKLYSEIKSKVNRELAEERNKLNEMQANIRKMQNQVEQQQINIIDPRNNRIVETQNIHSTIATKTLNPSKWIDIKQNY